MRNDHATEAGTQTYCRKHEAIGGRKLGRTGLTVSPVGFGGYRIHDRVPEHREALTLGLESGCNLIDTSTNYGNGGSEILVGQVLRDLFDAGKLSRDQVVVVSKAGYVQGDNLELARERADEGEPFPEMIEFSQDCWHCISPEFLEDQLSRSLQRLQLETLDVLLLHNPEYFLKAGGTPAEYYLRIRRAFEFLETQVTAGKIRWYGISSNTFPSPKTDEDATSLEAVLHIAREISPDHHFAVIQFPLNLYEPGGVLEENCSDTSTAVYARRNGIGTLINRPLNAFAHGRLFRLADFPPHDPGRATEDLQKHLNSALELESRYPGKDLFPARGVAWGHILHRNFNRLADLENWKGFLSYEIRPALAHAREALNENPAASAWLAEYLPRAEKLFASMTRLLEAQASQDSWRLTELLIAEIPELSSSSTLSRKAIRLDLSLEGIDCVLVGMRRPAYVRDALAPEAVSERVPSDSALRVLERIQQSVSSS